MQDLAAEPGILAQSLGKEIGGSFVLVNACGLAGLGDQPLGFARINELDRADAKHDQDRQSNHPPHGHGLIPTLGA